MEQSLKEHGLLHIIAQQMWHDEAFIVGTEEGLKRLWTAIDAAIKNNGKSHKSHLISADGEGYWGIVRCVSEDQMENIPFGYTDDCARDSRRIPEYVYRNLAGDPA